MVKGNCDGAARGNPGQVGFGVIFRNRDCKILLVVSKEMGITGIFVAECTTIVEGAEMALEKVQTQLWLETDSEAAVAAFKSRVLPWWLVARWTKCKRISLNILVTHNYREVNFSADQAVNRGAQLTKG
ncbi:hypothetical protein ACHQM5_001464 [Ranunculus cassubicifolius]